MSRIKKILSFQVSIFYSGSTALLFCFLLLLIPGNSFSQVINNNGASITVKTSTVVISTDAVNTAGSLSNSGIMNLGGYFTNMATTNGSTGTIRLGGNWTNTGIFNRGTSTVIFNGSNNQTISKPGGERFYNLTLANYGNTGTNYVGLSNNVEVTDTLTLYRGIINANGNRLFLSNAIPGALNYTSTTRSRIILGQFERGASETGTYLFPLGTANHYNPANLTTNTLPVPGTIISQFFTPPSIDSTGLPYDDPPDQVARVYQDGYWLMTASGGFSTSNFNINLRAAGFVFDTIRDVTRLIKRTGTDWAPDGTHSPAADSVVYRNNLTGGISGGAGTQFALGQPRPRILEHPQDTAVCEQSGAVFRIRASATKTLRYTWYKVGVGKIYGPSIIPVLVLINVNLLDAGDYYCIVTDDYGYSTRSNNAHLTVNKRPAIAIPPDQLHECSDFPFDNILINEINGVPGSFFSWTRDNPAGISSISVPMSDTVMITGGSIPGTFTNSTDNYLTVSFTITPIGPAGTYCTGPVVTTKVTVNPTPRVYPVNTRPEICYGGTTDITLGSQSVFTQGIIKLDFDVIATGGADLVGDISWESDLDKNYKIARTYSNNSDTLQSVTYRITPKIDNGICPSGVMVPQKVNVHAVPLQGITVVQQLTCIGGNNATLRADYSKGATPYSVVWNIPGGSKLYTQTITNLKRGPYYATVTDNLGCSNQLSTDVTGAYLSTLMEISSPVTCPGFSDAALTITVDGSTTGTPPFTYWVIKNSQDTVNPSGTQINAIGGMSILPGINSGDYKLILKDLNNCPDDNPPEMYVSQPDVIRITFDSSRFAGGYNISCKGYNDGWAEAKTITGGNPGGFTYLWTALSGGFTSINGTNKITGCTAGTYRLEVWDSKGCYMVDSVKLIEPTGLNLASSQVSFSLDSAFNISCFNGSNGFIKLNVTGGSGSYNYNWAGPGSPYPNSKNISDLRAGKYIVTITDVSNASCELRLLPGSTLPEFTLTEPTQLTAGTVISSPIYCYGETGSVDLTVNGGSIGNYKYNWTTSNGSGIVQGLQDQNSLRVGTYNVVVTDSNLCITSSNITLTQPDLLTVTLIPTHITCQSAPAFNNGSVDLTVGGGVAPYSYLWSNGAIGQDIGTLTAGDYWVTVTDANGCQKTDTVSVNLPPPVTYTSILSGFNGFNVSCYGRSDGSISINTTSGDQPYTYNWSGPNGFTSSSQNITGLKAGQYNLQITDKNSCTAAGTFNLAEPGKLYMNITKSASIDGNHNINCSGSSTGSITVDPVNQVGGVFYLWSDGITDKVRTDIPAGTYQVIILDLNNCNSDTLVTLTEPDSIRTSFAVRQAYCPDSPDGEITLTATGGIVTGDYKYKWSDGSTGQTITNILQGLYKVVVTDANNCSVRDSVEMEPQNETCLDIPNAISPNEDNINDVWNIGMTYLYPQMEIKIFNRWGEEIWRSARGYPDPWDGKSNGIMLPIDSYHYIIDLHNGSKPLVGNITIVR